MPVVRFLTIHVCIQLKDIVHACHGHESAIQVIDMTRSGWNWYVV